MKGLGETLVGAYPGRALSFVCKKNDLNSPQVKHACRFNTRFYLIWILKHDIYEVAIVYAISKVMQHKRIISNAFYRIIDKIRLDHEATIISTNDFQDISGIGIS